MSGIDDRIKYLEEFAESVMAGAYTQVAPLGPNSLSKHAIKAKSITGSMIDVTNLAAVKTKTGSLSVDGDLTIATGGSLRSGKTSYSDVANGGYYIGLDSGTPKIRVGNIGHSAGFTWDGSSLDVKGSISATGGSIGGWIIGPTDLTSDTGATGIASSGSLRFWIGNTTPSSAPFRVSSAGALTAESGTIGGWTINGITGLYLGSGASTRGIDTGSTTFFAGAATPSSAPFKVTSSGVLSATGATITGDLTASSLTITGTASFSGGTMTLPNGGSITSTNVDLNQGTLANLTVDGDITVGTGGKIKFGSGAADYLNNNILHFEVSSTEKAVIEWKNSTNTPYGRVSGNASSTGANSLIYADYNGSVKSYATFNGAYNGISTLGAFDLYAIRTGGTQEARLQGYADSSTQTVSAYVNGQSVFAFSNTDHFTRLMDSAGTYQFQIRDSGNVSVFAVNSDGDLIRPITNDATALGAYYGRIPIYINGSLKYLAVYS